MTLFRQPRSGTSTQRTTALPLLLYDLGAASQTFPPAPMLPEQFYQTATCANVVHGEVALRRAVLEDAIHCFQQQSQKTGRRAQRLAREAEEWLFADDHRWPFSFVNICMVLGLDPDYLRVGLKRWHHERPPTAHPRKRRTVTASPSLKIAA